MPVRGPGYTLYPLSINRVGFFLSVNRVKIRLFPSDFMRTYLSVNREKIRLFSSDFMRTYF